MRFEPTLIVTRLVVDRNGRAAYDELFHKGVNVIRGENSSGKSTILNFIFYGLGGDLAEWSEVALLCTAVTLEVQINGHRATLRREISSQIGQPMEIFGGAYEDSVNAPRADWVRYPYRRSPSLESFSQALFRLLGIPEVASDASANLTMHQILRLLYSDQLSPVENLFRFESQFDRPILRDAIGRLLCGGYDPILYENEVKIRELTREFDSATGELRSLFAVLGQTDHSLTMEWLAAERRSIEDERKELQREIEKAERALYTSASKDKLTLRAQDEAYGNVQRLQAALSAARQERDSVVLEIADSAAFIRGLESKISALRDSSSVAQHLGDVTFSACPACYAPINESEQSAPNAICHLCKTPFEPGRARERLVGMVNEAGIQLRQSVLLQRNREERLVQLEQMLQSLDEEWRTASDRLSELQRLPSTESRDRLRELLRQAGYLDRQLEDLNEKGRLIQMIDQIAARKNALSDQITRLKTDNERLRTQQEKRIQHAYTMIASEVRTLLRNDLRRQDSFEKADKISFVFADNRISVDDHPYVSASSRVILKSSFIVGFMAAATKDSAFRHPRFVMIDTTEDKGMEPDRSRNFQNQMLRVSQEAKVDHQIIYATAMISPDLDDEKYTIGKFSTRDDPTLNIG
jgi:hypothetical protein